jgi:peptidoglycan biosynthesis protein MviN/MurJ (putative lipid II flippase)
LSILFYKSFGLSVIILGVVLGALAHFLVQSIALYKEKIKIRLNLFKKEHVIEQLKFAAPRSGSIVISQLRILFFTGFATTLGVGVLTIYVFAERISDAALMVTVRSLSTASLPTLSKKISQGKEGEYNSLIHKHLRALLPIAIAISVVVILTKDYIIKILYGNTGENASIALFLMVIMLAFPFANLNMYLSNALSASRDTKTVFFANIFATPVSIGLAIYLKYLGFGLLSLAIGVTSASVLSTLGIFALLAIKKHIYEY